MEEVFRDTILPVRWMWCIVNNLEKFNERPEYINELIKKFKLVKDHYILSSFENVINSIEQYYAQNESFPSVEKLKIDFRDIRAIVVTTDKFSMQIYEALMQYIEQEIIRQKLMARIIDPEVPKMDDIRELAKDMSRFADKSVTIPRETKEMILNLYDDYSASFDGVATHVKPLDDIIGVLGYKSLSVFAAPSGHGKSTFALSVAYHNAVAGKCVEYLSFEIPKEHVWFNMASIESEGKQHPLMASKLKNSELTEEDKPYYRYHMKNFFGRVKESGGYLDVLDQTTAGINTYEALCAKLEARAEERKRKADLIIVDNIDNFQVLRSSDRDEVSKINNYIIGLDGFSKKYCNGAGTAILLLSQVNRPAMKRLYTSANDDSKSSKIDVTCIQKYNALYERATCVLVGFADESARASGIMRIHPVKLRNRAVPEQPIKVSVNYAYSKVRGNFMASKFDSQQAYENSVRGCFDNTADFEVNDIEDEKEPMMDKETEQAIEDMMNMD